MIIDILGGAWGVITAFGVFVIGFVTTILLARRFSVPVKRAAFIYLWHTLFCVLYILYARSNTADANGYFYRSLEPSAIGLGTPFVTAFASVFTRFLGFSYVGIFLIFNWIGSIGVLALYGALREVTFGSPRRLRQLSYVAVLLPSISFWSAALGKDAISFTATTLFLWSAINFRSRVPLCCIAILMMLCVRPHVAGLMIIAVAVSVAISAGVRPLSRLALLIFSLAAVLVTVPFAARYSGIEDFGSIESVTEFVDMRQSTNLEGGSSIDISSMSFPVQLFTYWFRPLPFEARGAASLASALDNLFLLCLLSMAAYSLLGRWRAFRASRPQYENTGMLIVYSLGASAVLAMVTANLGLAARQKWMVMPILVYLAFCVFASRPRHRAR